MTTSPEYAEYILELLSDFEIESKRMFGGVLLKVDGKQLGIIIDDQLYFKITDGDFQQKFKHEGSEQFSYMKKTKKDPVVIKNWWTVPEKYIDNAEEINNLARKVLDQ